MRTIKMNTLPKFYLSKRIYDRRNNPVVKYVLCKTYTKEERMQCYNEFINTEYEAVADAAYFRYMYGRPKLLLEILAL